jgi:hypothetical protein
VLFADETCRLLTEARDTYHPSDTNAADLGEGVLHRYERFLHGARGLIAHARHYVGVGIERYRHCGVAHEFLDELGVRSFTEQQRCARVPEVVEADVGDIRLPQEGGERTLAHVEGIEGVPVSLLKTRPWSA